MLLLFYVSILLINSFTYAHNTESPIDSSSSGSHRHGQGHKRGHNHGHYSSDDSETENDSSFHSNREDSSFHSVDESLSDDNNTRLHDDNNTSLENDTQVITSSFNNVNDSVSEDNSVSEDDSMSVDDSLFLNETYFRPISDSENFAASTKTTDKNYDTYVYFSIGVMLIGIIYYYVFNKYSSNHPNVQKNDINRGIFLHA